MSKEVQQYQELYLKAKKARLPFDREIWLNIAFFLDHTYVEWNNQSNSLVPLPRSEKEKHTPRGKANKINQFVMQSMTSSLRDKPTVDVLPASLDPTETALAAVCKAYTQWLADPQVENFDEKLVQASIWAHAGGESFLKWGFSEDKKHPTITAVSPLDLYPDPYAKSFAECRYVIHTQFMDVDQVEDIWGVKVKPSKVDKTDPIRNDLLRSMGVVPSLTGVEVRELWMKPCKKYPQGHYCVWTDQQILAVEEEYPYDHKRIPFTQLGIIPIPGCLHKTTYVTYLRQLQRELNKYHTQRIKIRENFASPKWGIPESIEMQNDPSDEPNQILRWDDSGALGAEPKLFSPVGMADNDEGSWIISEMMHTAGIHEVSQAQVPGRVEAARAIELLKESDDDRLAFFNRSVDSSISEGFWQSIQTGKQFLSEEQIFTIYSNDGLPEVHKFKFEEIKPGLRVKTTRTTGLAKSRTARADQIIMLYQNGLIKDPDRALQLMELSPVGNVYARAIDVQQATSENISMADGTPETANDWDDHVTHIEQHNIYRKSQEFKNASEEVRNIFEFHVHDHEQKMLEQMKKQAQMQQLMAPVQGEEQGAAPPDASAPEGMV